MINAREVEVILAAAQLMLDRKDFDLAGRLVQVITNEIGPDGLAVLKRFATPKVPDRPCACVCHSCIRRGPHLLRAHLNDQTHTADIGPAPWDP